MLIVVTGPVVAQDLHRAASIGDAEAIRILVAAGQDPNALDNVVGAPLHWAAARGHVDAAEALVAAGAEIDIRGAPPAGLTPLQMASSSGQETMVRSLIVAGADVSVGSAGYGTPLHFAALNDHGDVVSVLL
ncbi:MAG: ankyrin repeat domain-containing protein, partial [Pseudomonadota bacterium]